MVFEHLRRRLRDETGFNFVEVLVVMSLLSIILGYVLQTVASVQSAAAGAEIRLENLDEARTLMAVTSKDIRTAARLSATTSPFLLADDNEVTFYANLHMDTECPKKVHLHVDGSGRLIEDVTEPDAGAALPNCTYVNNDTRTRLVGRYIANASTEPLFTYYYDNGGTQVAFSDTLTPLSSSDRLLVGGVGIRFSIRKDTTRQVAPTTLVNKVRLPNVNYNPIES